MRRWGSAAMVAAFVCGAGAASADVLREDAAAEGVNIPPAVFEAGSGGLPSVSEQPLLPSPATGQRGVQLRTNVLDSSRFRAGPTIDVRPSAVHPETPAIAARRDESSPVELGGFVGYLFHDDITGLPTSSLGLDLQIATDTQSSSNAWLVQPGIDYSTPLAPSLQLNTRLFSTFAPDGYSGALGGLDRTQLLRGGGNAEPGFQDVGVGLGLGYTITDNWAIQTQARYQRMLGVSETEKQNEVSPHQFFGGVMVDYKF